MGPLYSILCHLGQLIDGAEIIQSSLIYSCTIFLSWEDSGITRAPKAPLSVFLGSLCMIWSLYHCVLRAMDHLMYQPRMVVTSLGSLRASALPALSTWSQGCPGQGEKNKVRRFWKAACQAEILLWPFFFNATVSLFLFSMKNRKKVLIEHRSLDLLSKIRSEAGIAMRSQFYFQMSGLHRLQIAIAALTLNTFMMLAFHEILL